MLWGPADESEVGSEDKDGGRRTYRLCARVWRFHAALSNCFPDVVDRDIIVCPGNGEERGVPADHGRRLFVSHQEVLEPGVASISRPVRGIGELTSRAHMRDRPVVRRSILCTGLVSPQRKPTWRV